MEPENTPLEKEKNLPNHHFSGSMLIFRGEKTCRLTKEKKHLNMPRKGAVSIGKDR